MTSSWKFFRLFDIKKQFPKYPKIPRETARTILLGHFPSWQNNNNNNNDRLTAFDQGQPG